MTYNIHHANPPSQPGLIDLEAIARVIKESDADLVALQEVDVKTERSGVDLDQAAALGELTGMYHYFEKSIDHQGGEYGNAILSRFPIEESSKHAISNMEGVNSERRAVLQIKVDVEGQPFWFASTHLDYSNKENNLHQSKEVAGLYRDSEIPVILAGDFNALPDSEGINYLEGYFERTCRHNCGYTIPEKNPNRTIDFIMFTKDAGIEVVEHRVIPEEYASDHRPVFASLTY
ncbi:endonuclease/exonuclease/phosphatase family protein [Litoribacter alkaliphilus]|uniref:Endonuclease/exonuclease/phosphatase family protein n=1 Tax=Litoribacter ruber TaxID=702568 RepID=A0AAP2G5N3_9BACT|nr:endonuclease/exonuclease/phosphatase family protein [Litoribacter alkaliphilus]